jgi:hypothetical protein
MVDWFHCFGPEANQYIMAGSIWRSKAAHIMEARKQNERKGPGTRYILPVIYNLSDLLPPTRLTS